jgi:trimeric autotransporter adhesin
LVGILITTSLLAGCGADAGTAVDNPTPGITALNPAAVDQGAASPSITIAGSDFVETSAVQVNGSTRPTSFVSRSQLRVTLSDADVFNAGILQLSVFNPAPGGGTSNSSPLTVRVRTNPPPTLTSSSPVFVPAGSTGVTVTLEGTGFVPQSVVVFGFATHGGVTYVSPTQLRVALTDAEIASAGTLVIRVVNPSPGGGSSADLQLQVRSPVPILTTLSTNQGQAGQLELSLGVTGTGFVKNTVVRFNGAPRATTFVSGTSLGVLLLEGDLRAAGTFAISAENPAPGGGTSNALSFQLTNGTPTISMLPSSGAHAGRPGFSLIVSGTGFVDGAVVRWNGAARSTQYVSATRVVGEISAADVVAAGTAQVTVVNPAPGGGTSAPAVMTIRAVGAATATSRQAVKLSARDLAPDDQRNLIYLSIGGNAALDANSVVALDPQSGTVTQRVFVGSNPGRLARSDDGQFLYVGLDGANAVRRVDLPSLTAALQWSVGAGQVAGELLVLPSRPRSVAVSRQSPGFSPPLNGVTVYDDGVARAQSSPGHTGGNRIAFLASPDTLYGYNNAHSGFEFFTIALDATGARHAFTNGGLIGGYYTQITGGAGRIYGTDGSVVDAQRRTRVGTFGIASSSTAVDPVLGRAFMLVDSGIAVYDLNNFQHLGTVAVPNISLTHPALSYPHLVRWGTNGLAFLDEDEVFIVRSPLFGP